MRGKGVPQRMRRNILGDAGAAGVIDPIVSLGTSFFVSRSSPDCLSSLENVSSLPEKPTCIKSCAPNLVKDTLTNNMTPNMTFSGQQKCSELN
jgi:hypothetical protein